MTYRLKLDESLQKGARRIVRREIEAAVAAQPDADAGRWVHETRKGLKRLRALLRLVRDGLPAEDRRIWAHELAAIGRVLSGQRDLDVVRATLASLAAAGGAAGKGAAAALRGWPKSHPPQARNAADHDSAMTKGGAKDRAKDPTSDADEVRKRLAAIGLHLARLPLSNDPADDLAVIEAGLVRAHRAGRRALAAVGTDPDDEALHALRKAVQVHWRQMQLLSAAAPDLMTARTKSARDLAQRLGWHHDLALVTNWLGPDAPARGGGAGRRALAEACHLRQRQIQVAARLEAGRLFAGKPRWFAAEVIACWRIGQLHAAPDPPMSGGQPPRRKSAASAIETASPNREGAGAARRLAANKGR